MRRCARGLVDNKNIVILKEYFIRKLIGKILPRRADDDAQNLPFIGSEIRMHLHTVNGDAERYALLLRYKA